MNGSFLSRFAGRQSKQCACSTLYTANCVMVQKMGGWSFSNTSQPRIRLNLPSTCQLRSLLECCAGSLLFHCRPKPFLALASRLTAYLWLDIACLHHCIPLILCQCPRGPKLLLYSWSRISPGRRKHLLLGTLHMSSGTLPRDSTRLSCKHARCACPGHRL